MKHVKALALQFVSSRVAPLFVFGILSFTIAHADNSSLPQVITDASDLQKFMCSIASWFFWIVLILSTIMILYAAFQYVTARDDQEKTSKARKTITYAAIGVAVAFMAAAFPTLVASVFPDNPNLPQGSSC